MHKFIGGPSGSPGILVAKKNLFKNPVPQETGGGIVFYVRNIIPGIYYDLKLFIQIM